MSEDDALSRAARFHIAAQRAQVLRKHGVAYDRADRARQRWDGRWEQALMAVWPKIAVPESALRAAERTWGAMSKSAPERPEEPAGAGAEPPHVSHDEPQAPPADLMLEMEEAIRARAGSAAQFVHRALPVYMSLAEDTSADSGQSTLDALGLNATWKWTSARDIPRDLFAVRGSKVLMQSYDNHVGRLARIIVDATDPAAPRTMSEKQRLIREAFPEARASDVRRIARTESANVWETTNYNAQRANGVDEFDWLVAHGPSIGPPKSYPVCKECLERATNGPYRSGDVDWKLPPQHPNCRCTLVPKLAEDWLPPAETWSGGPEPPLPLVPSEVP